MTTFKTSQKKLDDALQTLGLLIKKTVQITKSKDNTRAAHIENLNKELQKENTLLKEQLFAAISNMNSFKNKNKIIHDDIDEIVEELEKVVN
jgi:hypothetical protein